MLVMMAWRHRTAAAAAGAWMNELYKDDNLAKYARGSSWLQYASATLCRPPAHASSAPTLRGIVLYLQCDDTGSSTLSFNDDRTSLLYRSIDTDHYTPQRTWTSNNKWSKNVDERPHRRLVTPLGGKWIRRTLIYGSLGLPEIVTHDLDLWPFDPKTMGFQDSSWNICMSSLVILAASLSTATLCYHCICCHRVFLRLSVRPSVCLPVRHKPALYKNG